MRATRLPYLLLLASPLACSDLTDLGALVPRIEADPSIDFSDVQVGMTASRQLTVKNTGELNVNVTGLAFGEGFESTRYTFSAGPSSFSIVPGGSQILAAGFQPYEVMAEPGRSYFEVMSDGQGEDGSPVKARVEVSGRGVPVGLAVAPNPLDFGVVLAGLSRTLDVTFTNGLPDAVVLSVPLDGDRRPELIRDSGQGQFQIVGNLGPEGTVLPAGSKLEPGASVSLTLRYVPDAGGSVEPDHAHFKVLDCPSPLCAVTVELLGRGSQSALECAPVPLAFGAVNPDLTASRRVSCRNVASDPVELTDWALDLSSAPEFEVEPFAAGVLQPNDTVEVEVLFTPSAADLASRAQIDGILVVRSRNQLTQDGLTPVRIPLSGSAGGPAITVLPRNLSFGQVQLGTRDARGVLISNEGFDPLQVQMIGTSAAEFSASPTSFQLAVGTSTVVVVSFAPSALGLQNAELVIDSNDGLEPRIRVGLDGTGVDLGPCVHSVTPSNLAFGIVDLGQQDVRSIQITNNGSGSCLINHLDTRALASTSSLAFQLPAGPESNVLLGPGQTKIVDVAFVPQQSAQARGELSYYVSDPSGPDVLVPLYGVGLGTTRIMCPPPVRIDAGSSVQLAVIGTSQTPTVAFYDWQLTAAPLGGSDTPGLWAPAPPEAPSETFTPIIVGVYNMEVTLSDGLGMTDTCTTSVTAVSHGLRVELTWDGLGDVDLHLHNANITPWFGRGGPTGANTDDCFYANCNIMASPAGPVWDVLYAPYEGRNPALDVDNIVGSGPENIRVDRLSSGDHYTVALHYFWDHGHGPRVGTVKIYCGRTLVPSGTFVSDPMIGLDQGGCTDNSFWRVAGITFSSTTACSVTPIDTYTPGSDACAQF